jgi:hypothetical protein
MASFFKFNDFVEQLGLAKHNLNTDVQNIYLSNAAPSASADTIKTELAEITNQNGYTAPVDIQNTYAESSGTGTLTGTAVTITASGGTVGPFQYVVLYNDTQTSPVDPLIGSWDYGSAITLQSGETFTWKPNNSPTTGTVLTIA